MERHIVLGVLALPPNEAWGKEGFTYPTEENAITRFREMAKERNAYGAEGPFHGSDGSTPLEIGKTPRKAAL